MERKLYYIVCLIAVLFVMGCEDLEDTYDEYAGDGKIRYIGKCSDLKVQPGWNRLRVVWKNSQDAAIKQVKITWQSERDEKPFVKYVERKKPELGLMDTIFLDNLQNAVYAVTLCGVSADSTESISEQAYVRPYTSEHEDLRTFTRGITSFYPMRTEGKMVVVLDEDNENLQKVILHYYDTEGQKHEWDVKENMNKWVWYDYYRHYMFLLPEEDDIKIDFDKGLIVEREGMLPGCIDEVPFKGEELDPDEKIWSGDFSQCLTKKYGTDWESKLLEIETVELDYDMVTFQDLFYFPNLKKVILGKNRYMLPDYQRNLSITDGYQAVMTLHYLEKIRENVEVERYNSHYMGTPQEGIWAMLSGSGLADADLLTDKGTENLEELRSITLLNTEGWKVTCSDTVYSGEKTNGAGWLLSEEPDKYFEPGQTSSVKVYEVIIDMLEGKELHGFKVVQPDPKSTTNAQLAYLLSALKIEVSEDGYAYMNATYEDGGISIGNNIGETTLIEIPENMQGKRIRYIRLTMNNLHVGDMDYGNTPYYSFRLGEFRPY